MNKFIHIKENVPLIALFIAFHISLTLKSTTKGFKVIKKSEVGKDVERRVAHASEYCNLYFFQIIVSSDEIL